jgi:acylaminoacyl-peptidase
VERALLKMLRIPKVAAAVLLILGIVTSLAMGSSSAFAATDGARPASFSDLEGVRGDVNAFVNTLAVSPDGRSMASANAESLQIIDASTGRVKSDLGQGQAPCWSPVGKAVAFYSARSGSMQLWFWDAATGAVRSLTGVPNGIDPDPRARIAGYVIQAFDCSWSPDGKQLVFTSRVSVPVASRPEGTPLVLDGNTTPGLTLEGVFMHPGGATGGIPESPDGVQWLYRAAPGSGHELVSRLFTVDVGTGTVRQIEGPAGSLFHPQWSPDGRQLAYAAIATGGDLLTSTSTDIRIWDLEEQKEKIVASGKDLKYRPKWSPDGRSIAYLKGKDASAAPDIEIADLSSGSRSFHRFGRRILKFEWARRGNRLVLSYVDGTELRLARLSLLRDPAQPLATGAAIGWAQTAGGALLWGTAPLGRQFWRIGPGESSAHRIGALKAPPAGPALKLGRAERVEYRSYDGQVLEGALLYPPDYRPGRPYPMIVDVYPMHPPGLDGSEWMQPLGGNQAWAAAGYLVFKPYVRAPNAWANCSSDPRFCTAARGAPGWDTAFGDAMGGLDALVARGLVDPDRICLYGHSNGGGVAAYLATRTDRFRCIVIVAPALPSWLGSPLLSTELWPLLTDWAGKSPLEAPGDFLALSSVFRANRVKAPVLLADGDDDGMFLLGSIELYNALRFAKADVTFLRYPDQGHLLRGPALQDFWAREMAFFKAHLQE